MEKILILHGLDHDKMGKEAGSHSVTMEQINARLEQTAEECGVVLSFYQSNDCSSVVQTVLEAGAKGFGGIVFNPAAWVDTGAEIAGALKQSGLPIVEVHMSNICKTADSHNVIAPSVTGLVTGFGEQVYSVGLKMLAAHLRADN
ncbi:MAG: type II 3-dehydroquinate dehydratase [Lawsonibacter sp.]|nr:type II 3-dehydroquinate dehydratase [Lawsonibacter sp.]